MDAFVEALKAIASGAYTGNYVQDMASGEFHPEGWTPDFHAYFSLS